MLLTLVQQLRREAKAKVDQLLAAEGIAKDHANVAEAGFDRQIVQREAFTVRDADCRDPWPLSLLSAVL